MNVNVKISISDEDRNVMFRRLTGKNTKGMVSRADVNEWVKEQLENFLRLGSPTTEQIGDAVADAMADSISDNVRIEDYTREEIEEIVKQNKLLLTRVNILQHRLDTKR